VNPQRAAFRVALAAAAVALVAEILLDEHAPGINVVLSTAVLLLAALAVRPPQRPFDSFDAWLPVGAIVFALFVSLRDDRSLVTLDTVAALGLAGASIAALAGLPVTRAALPALFELAGTVTIAAFGGASIVIRFLSLPSLATAPVALATPRVVPVARGLVIVTPLLVVFAVLFAAADPIFETFAVRALTVDFDLGRLPFHLVFVAIVAWVAGGLLWFVEAPPGVEGERSLCATVRGSAAGWPRLGATEAITILIALDVLFALFVVLQVAYLFGGQDTRQAAGLPYAQYARRGFFELLTAVALAGSLVGVLEAIVQLRRRTYVAALLVLVALTAVVLASSFLRLRLYQEAYGWTELRFYVDAAIVFFGIGLGLAGVLIAANASRWLGHALGVAALAVLFGVNVIGPQKFITDRNLERVLVPGVVPEFGEETLDTAYLGSFDADAVPPLVEAIPRLSMPARTDLENRLRELRDRLETDRGDPAAWNLAREEARAALDAWYGPPSAPRP
jgi:Domain of unknown function (DUF4173)